MSDHTKVFLLGAFICCILNGCIGTTTTPTPIAGPTSDLCTSTHPLTFSIAAVMAMGRADLEQYDGFNETWTKQCAVVK